MMVIQLPMVFVLVLIDDVGVNPDDVDGGVGGANTVSAGAIADRCDGDIVSVGFSDDVGSWRYYRFGAGDGVIIADGVDAYFGVDDVDVVDIV